MLIPTIPYIKPEDVKLTFTGTRKEMGMIYLKALLPMIFTLGLYRFWQNTKARQFIWKNINFQDEALEYIGTGKELFIGFLIALCVIVPLNIGFTLGSLTTFQLPLFIALFLVSLYFTGFGLYAGRRYRLNRTLWRGLRFKMAGSAWKFGAAFLGWWLLQILTLGIITPWAHAWQERVKMRHTSFGSVTGEFTGEAFTLFKKLLPFTIITMLPPVIAVFSFFTAISWSDVQDLFNALLTFDEEVISDTFKATFEDTSGKKIGFIIGMFILSLFLYICLLPAIKAIKFTWWANGLKLGDVRLSANFTSLQSYKIWGKYFLLGMAISTALSIGLALIGMIFAFIGVDFLKDIFAFFKTNKNLTVTIITIFTVIFYVLALFFTAIFYKLFVTFSYIRDQTNSMTLHNLASLNDVLAENQDTSAIGEALADQDIGGFAGL